MTGGRGRTGIDRGRRGLDPVGIRGMVPDLLGVEVGAEVVVSGLDEELRI